MWGFIAELRRRNVLRVAVAYLAAAWLLVQVIATTLPALGVQADVLRWVIIAAVVGFVPALALSWAFEWTAAGIETQAEADRRTPDAAAPHRTFDRAVIVVLSLAVLYFAADKFLLPEFGGAETSVAVLPFADLTARGDSAYLGDGLAEDVLTELGRNGALKVVARTSAFRFRDSNLPVAEIARMLDVSHVLEGSIRNVGDRYRINVQLISARDGFNVWSHDFDRDAEHLYDTVEEIRAGVESVLGAAATSVETPAAPPDPEAYVLALQANYLFLDGSDDSRARAIELYRQALEIDPDNAVVWSDLAAAYSESVDSGAMEQDEAYAKALDAALSAVRSETGVAAGYVQLASIQAFFEGNLGAAVTNMQRAIDLDPYSEDTLGNAANLLLRIGRPEGSVKLDEHLAARSPLDAVGLWNLALGYRYIDRLADSERTFLRVKQLSPGYFGMNYHLGETVLLRGRAAEALALFEVEEDEAYRLKGVALAEFALGRMEEADRALAELIDKYGPTWPSEVAHVYAYRNERDQAFAWLDREFDTYGPGGWGEWQQQRLYDNLRDDPRWHAFLVRTGTAPEQLADYELKLPPEVLR